MSLFYANYGCHEGAFVMRKSDGVIFRVRGNVSLWDMTAILELWSVEKNALMYTQEEIANDMNAYKASFVVVRSKEFAEQFLILDEGKDRLDDAFKKALAHIVSSAK